MEYTYISKRIYIYITIYNSRFKQPFGLFLVVRRGSHAVDLLKLRSRRHDCTPLMLAAGASGCPASVTVAKCKGEAERPLGAGTLIRG